MEEGLAERIVRLQEGGDLGLETVEQNHEVREGGPPVQLVQELGGGGVEQLRLLLVVGHQVQVRFTVEKPEKGILQ